MRGVFRDEVAPLLSISPWDGLKVLCAWILLVALRDGAFFFHSEESEAQRIWVTHPGSHSQNKASQGAFCSLPTLGGCPQANPPSRGALVYFLLLTNECSEGDQIKSQLLCS